MRVCGSCAELLAICDECDAMWVDPDTATLPFFPSQPGMECPFCGVEAGGEHWRAAAETDWQGTRWEKPVHAAAEAKLARRRKRDQQADQKKDGDDAA